MIEQMKASPIKSAISIITLLSMLVGGVLSIDSRYAKAADFEKQEQYLIQSTKDTQRAIDQLRKQNIEDKIFELELIPEDKRTQIDKARLQKYRRDAQNIDLKWNDK